MSNPEPITQLLKEVAIQTVFEQILKSMGRFLKEKKLKFTSNTLSIEEAIFNHTHQINNWSKEISFSELMKEKKISETFIEVDILLMPRKKRIDPDECIGKIKCQELFEKNDKHLVILGQPGAGKTTLMKYLCQSVLFDPMFYADQFTLPILVRLRELNSYTGDHPVIFNYLFDQLGLSIAPEDKNDQVKEQDINLTKKRLLFHLLEKLCPLIILDGFDELATEKLKSKVVEEYKEYVLASRSGRIILTSRSSDYNYSIENTSVLEIAPLTEDQIASFSKKWLIDDQKVDDFLKNLQSSPFADTSIRPLALSHLCAIYERSGKIPDKPKTIYKKIVNLLLEDWDQERNVRRLTSYGNFEIDRKFEFLSNLAFEITTRYNQTVFSEDQLKEIYLSIYVNFSLPKNEASKVVKELESHSGLILQSGFKSFEFAHKSIHEYLSAEHLVKLPAIPKNGVLINKLPNELAIATAISSDPSAYFSELVLHRLSGGITNRFTRSIKEFSNYFYATYVNRLVIEKPDFNHSKEISYALVVLYTLLRNNDTGQLVLFETDLPLQFEDFLKLVFTRNRKFEFTKYYTLAKVHKSENAEDIIELKKTAKGDTYILDLPLLPKLYAKRSFITGFD